MKISYTNLARQCQTARLTRRASRPGGFTGNAIAVLNDDGTIDLVSYRTIVAHVDTDGVLHKCWDNWSVSTAAHIRMFAEEYAPRWYRRFGTGPDGVYRGGFKANWLDLPCSTYTNKNIMRSI